MKAVKTQAQFKKGDYLINTDGEILQVTTVHPAQYSVKIWKPEYQDWSSVSRRAKKRTDTTYRKISKQEMDKKIDPGFYKFLQIIKELKIDTDPYTHWSESVWNDEKKPGEPIIGVQWTTGGAEGGNCWNDKPPESWRLEGEPEKELEALDKILEHFKPDITFIQYKRLCQELVVRGKRRYNEYYGNYTDYAHKYVKLRQLYKHMKDQGWITA